MSTSRAAWKRAWPQVLLVLGIWIASVPAAELAFRAVGVRTANLTSGIYEAFGDRGYRLRPSKTTFMNWYPDGFTVITDQRGFRVSVSRAASPEPDVLVLGDSQAFGTGLDHDQSVIGQFAEHARKGGVVVANAAIGGHLLRNQLELIRHLQDTEALRFKSLLICLTPRGIYQVDEYNQNHVHEGGLYSKPPSRGLLMRKWLTANSAAFTVLRNAYRRTADEGGTSPTSFAYYRTGANELRQRRDLSAVIKGLVNLASEQEASCALAYFPIVGEERILAAAGADEYSVEVPRRVVASVSKEAGIPFIDLGPAIARVQASGERASLVGDPHYGRATSRACGELLWTALDWHAHVPRDRRKKEK